ncbi:protein-L-isoaspartate O-methyltransferase [Streptomyces sp. GbtcB6]|uniref:protein-L-isoaspartate O-methyltransferase family protein n=1 Tax=Streptomyces sp. GbtcB6 TaxID=2824751 RepID=UPI0020C5D014|nr:methyltransferase domain-containing protein [Streptomyces sp. GbtcB6]
MFETTPHAAAEAMAPTPGATWDAEASKARAAMVARLVESGDLSPGPVADALLMLPRQRLMPQAYVRRSAPDETPPRWDLLDWSHPEHRPELLGVLHSGDGVAVQHDGEPLLNRRAGGRSGGAMTAMSSVMGMTARLLDELDLRPGQRVLDVGTGAGVTCAVACLVAGDADVVSIDCDDRVTEGAAAHLAALGLRPTVVTGDGERGRPERAPYDRVLVSFAVPRVPVAPVEQLAPQGVLLATVGTSSPSWPGLAVITKTDAGVVQAELRAAESGHRAGWGRDRLSLSAAFREQISAGGGVATRGHRPPPEAEARGMWLALDHLHPGLVRAFGAPGLQIGSPACGSWVRVSLEGDGTCTVTSSGPRAIWEEIEETAARWQAAGEPALYRLEFASDGTQWASAGHGGNRLSWQLTDHRPDRTRDAR